MNNSTQTWKGYAIALFAMLLAGCVGPTSPFGPLSRSPQPVQEGTLGDGSIEIAIQPPRKIYHHRANFKIDVQSPTSLPEDASLRIYHQNYLVEGSLFSAGELSWSEDRRRLTFSIDDVRFRTLDPSRIQVEVVSGGAPIARVRLPEPICSLYERMPPKNFQPFRAPAQVPSLIERIAREKQLNPGLLAGLIAQESGFDPKALSWARAMGLTQITPVAEKQILFQVEDWPRHPEARELSYPLLKTKILSDEINAQTEWRLDPEKSLRGGVAYLFYLQEYWSRADNQKLYLDLMGSQDEEVFTELILASYNSGPARVKKALKTSGKNWKAAPQLREAVRYLKRVKSFCFHSSYGGANDNET